MPTSAGEDGRASRATADCDDSQRAILGERSASTRRSSRQHRMIHATARKLEAGAGVLRLQVRQIVQNRFLRETCPKQIKHLSQGRSIAFRQVGALQYGFVHYI